MKWNMVLGALVVSIGLCSQSFGFELLDRMLGVGCGCEQTCCAKPVQSCCEQPACGCDTGCGHHGGLLDGLFGSHHRGCGCAAPSCCEAAAPSCGCEAAAPSCGCEAAPSCGCGGGHGHHGRRGGCGHHGGLLSGLFGCHKGCGCASACAPSCGCGAPVGGAPVMDGGDAAPMPPAPMADPQASRSSQRRLVRTSSLVTR